MSVDLLVLRSSISLVIVILGIAMRPCEDIDPTKGLSSKLAPFPVEQTGQVA